MTSKPQLVQSFENYTRSVAEAFDAIHELLNMGRYADAADIMSLVTTRQVQVSVKMRSACIKLEAKT